MVVPEPNPNRDPNSDPDIQQLLGRLYEFLEDQRVHLTRLQFIHMQDTLGELEERIYDLEHPKWLT